jgi:hypothetical protein
MTSCLLLEKAPAQTSNNATNLVSVAEAVKIASNLRSDMEEADADKYLASHGLTCDPNPPQVILENDADCLFWSTYYPLKGNCSLKLDYWHMDSTDAGTNTNTGWERTGILAGAEILSNGVDITSIKLAHPENTPPLTVADAIKIASGLRAGMKDDDADEYLHRHGIYRWTSSPMSNCWQVDAFPLNGPFCLQLEYSNACPTDLQIPNGPLARAEITSNSVDAISITLMSP